MSKWKWLVVSTSDISLAFSSLGEYVAFYENCLLRLLPPLSSNEPKHVYLEDALFRQYDYIQPYCFFFLKWYLRWRVSHNKYIFSNDHLLILALIGEEIIDETQRSWFGWTCQKRFDGWLKRCQNLMWCIFSCVPFLLIMKVVDIFWPTFCEYYNRLFFLFCLHSLWSFIFECFVCVPKHWFGLSFRQSGKCMVSNARWNRLFLWI